MKYVFSFLLTCLCFHIGFGQINVPCEKVYSITEIMPKYRNGDVDLALYIIDKIGYCMQVDTNALSINSFYATLTINEQGRVIEVLFKRPKLSESCKTYLQKQLYAMIGWSAAKQNGINVCVTYSVGLSCIKWD